MCAEGSPAAPKSTNRPTPAHYARIADLLTLAQGGDREAMAELVADLTPLLWQVARSQGLDRDNAADAVQTTWLHLLASLNRIRDPFALTGWLITATRRESWRIRDASRSELAAEEGSLAVLPDPDAPPEEQFLLDERKRSLWSAVAQLPERCQQLLRIVAFAHRPDYDAVGAALGMRRGSIGPTRGRCLAKLRTLLVADEGRSWTT
ncbi:MAG TPA: sigma-70 family RNA polymerase sigma factor [Pseudonocardiaceae bacterium]|jgi:RNA polymerase sigma factor (sigma-70 family)|nr:sigma-70 family RNA polymerase sigma factor [Pseudonocardiaceae bacterium]